MTRSYSHSIEYKGFTIICDNGLYYVAGQPYRTYFSLQPCKIRIDKLTEKSDENNVSTIYKPKTHK